MPELPEVEILVRHLAPLLKNKTICSVMVRRPKILAPTTQAEFTKSLTGATFTGLSRRAKYLVFVLQQPGTREPLVLLGHLGMTGRMFLSSKKAPLPKHAAVVFELDKHNFVFEDTRYFGRLTLDLSAISKLGPEPLEKDFTPEYFFTALKRSAQAIKIKLLDQTLVAGVGNIYASEALFRAQISPRTPARKLSRLQAGRLHLAIREVLIGAVEQGSTLPLNFGEKGSRDGLFYYGDAGGGSPFYAERLCVYDRAGKPCLRCGTAIKRFVQAARSTFYCPNCQRRSVVSRDIS